jgi:hypothetical protein
MKVVGTFVQFYPIITNLYTNIANKNSFWGTVGSAGVQTSFCNVIFDTLKNEQAK